MNGQTINSWLKMNKFPESIEGELKKFNIEKVNHLKNKSKKDLMLMLEFIVQSESFRNRSNLMIPFKFAIYNIYSNLTMSQDSKGDLMTQQKTAIRYSGYGGDNRPMLQKFPQFPMITNFTANMQQPASMLHTPVSVRPTNGSVHVPVTVQTPVSHYAGYGNTYSPNRNSPYAIGDNYNYNYNMNRDYNAYNHNANMHAYDQYTMNNNMSGNMNAYGNAHGHGQGNMGGGYNKYNTSGYGGGYKSNQYQYQPNQNKKKRGWKQTTQCRFYEKGLCNNEECPFQHGDKGWKMCWDFKNGQCKRGNTCKWLHSANERTNFKSKAKEKANRPQGRMCWEFVAGNCPRGSTCRWLHSAAIKPTQNKKTNNKTFKESSGGGMETKINEEIERKTEENDEAELKFEADESKESNVQELGCNDEDEVESKQSGIATPESESDPNETNEEPSW